MKQPLITLPDLNMVGMSAGLFWQQVKRKNSGMVDVKKLNTRNILDEFGVAQM
jgi:hypothetical protein